MASIINVVTRFSVLGVFLLACAISLEAQLSHPGDPINDGPKDVVIIYLDFTGASLGHSPYRRLRLELELSALKNYRSYPVAEPTGWDTSVFVSADTEQKLRLDKLPISQYINNRGGIYYLKYEGIDIAFGLEVPPKAVFEIIVKTYKDEPEVGKLVADHYRSGYTVRIYEAENALEPENQLISYPEAIMAAAIIGDKEQWLWGLHDGRDLLNQPLQQ